MKPPITDTQRRFLLEVARRLPPERVREVYLFNPMKQGGIETGVAVFAAGEAPLVPSEEQGSDAPVPGPGDGAVQAAESSDPTEAAAREEPAADDADAPTDTLDEPPSGEPAAEVVPLAEVVGPEAEVCVVDGEVMPPADADDDAPSADATRSGPVPRRIPGFSRPGKSGWAGPPRTSWRCWRRPRRRS